MSLFRAWPADVFRKAVDKVGRIKRNDLRAAVQGHVSKEMQRLGKDVPQEVYEHFFLHQRQLQLTAYMVVSTEAISKMLWGKTDGQDVD